MFDLTNKQIKQLFSISSEKEMEAFLEDIGAKSGNGWKWDPLGGRPNNSGSVNLAVEPGQALVERITNGMDAHIELQHQLAGCPRNLNSPRSAVAHLWDSGAERLSRESSRGADFIDRMAPKTVVRAVGSTKESTIIVEDRGIGQRPKDFPDTLLSLGESNKISKPYLMGAFGQGGSSTFAYCPYSIIVSRRHTSCLDGEPDLVGWTVVREYDDESMKMPSYQYLVGEDDHIPVLTPDKLKSLGRGFEPGTHITHIAYDLGKLKQSWSLVGYRYFDNLLFDPVLPYRIEDHRFRKAFNRNLAGGRSRLDQADPARRPESRNCDVALKQWGGEGIARIRYWVFRPAGGAPETSDDESVKLDSYLDYSGSTKTIVFTLNGQRHHTEEKRIVRKERMAALADYLLMQVDCDGLSMRLKKKIFTATRSGVAAGEKRADLILQAVRFALKDSWLRQKMEEIARRRQEQISDESTKRVRRMLDNLISVHRAEQRIGGRKGSDKGGTSRKGEGERQTHDPPKKLQFADHRLLEMCAGETKTIHLLTDGPDDLLSRTRRQGRLSLSCGAEEVVSCSVTGIHEGRIAVHIHAQHSASIGQRTRIEATLEVEPATYLKDSRDLRIVAPPPPYEGSEPPTLFEFTTNTPLAIEQGGKASAEIRTDARNDILDRAVNPASIQFDCDAPGVSVAVRSPRDGTARVEVHAERGVTPETKGTITVILESADGAAKFITTRPCRVIPAKEPTPRPGIQTAPIPAYRIIHVYKDAPEDKPKATTWDTFPAPWNEKKVGTWGMNVDELDLHVNMDEHRFRLERTRFNRRFGEGYAQRLADRHVAYLAFHLFQLHEQSQTGESANGEDIASNDYILDDPDSAAVNLELQRVVATLIQTLRSEAELRRLEGEANEDD